MGVQQNIDRILKKPISGERITSEEAMLLLKEGDLLNIMQAARDIRNQKLPPERTTYTLFRIINYTSNCKIMCNFCNYYHKVGSSKGKTLTPAEVISNLNEDYSRGVNQLFLQGGVNPELPYSYYLDMITAIRSHFGEHLQIRAFSPVEIFHMARQSEQTISQVIHDLKRAGVDSVPGAGAEILSDRMRSILSPHKLSVQDWLSVMQLCHENGLYGSANIVFGSDETLEEIVEHLRLIRDLQDKTGGFYAFIPWTFQKQTSRFKIRMVSSPEFLRVLGVCRLFLDNIDHIEISLMVLGMGVGAIALHGGADDISSVVIEENVLQSHAPETESEAKDFILNSGFIPTRRDFNYKIINK